MKNLSIFGGNVGGKLYLCRTLIQKRHGDKRTIRAVRTASGDNDRQSRLPRGQHLLRPEGRQLRRQSVCRAGSGEGLPGLTLQDWSLDDEQLAIDHPQLVMEGRLLLVADVLQVLKMLAREHRRQFQIPVIGITGTNGKTTTKELIRAVLAEKYNVLATEGNFNNDVGVPKTLFRLTKEHEIAVIEMGASHPGDIKTLVETAEPTCGLITNVGKAHLQGFGSLKGVLQTKGELYDFLAKRQESVIFINADNELLVSILPDSAWVAPYSQNVANAEGCVVGQPLRAAEGDVYFYFPSVVFDILVVSPP